VENKLNILKLNESKMIQSLINKCEKKDIFISTDYLKLFSNYLNHEAFYVFYGNEENYILIPYLKRPIEKLNNQYYDLVSPWYYGGPIYFSKDKNNLNSLFKKFILVFNEYCLTHNIITEFQRFHPLLENHKLYGDNANVIFDRKIVYVDLRKDLDVLRQDYTRHTRKNINKALKNNLKIQGIDGDEDMYSFIKAYTQSMRDKNARDFYHFNDKFFEDLFNQFGNQLKQFNIEKDGELICSSVELGNYGILHDYLRGADPKQLLLRPNDILIDEIIRWAKEYGYSYFILGGGASSNEEDGIFKFKKSFSSTTADFFIYKKIHNLNKYKQLCEQNGKGEDTLSFEKATYFPEYLE
jgi:hypothetical protein